MEQRDDLLLQLGLEIDEQIAADDEVEAREEASAMRFCGANTTASRNSFLTR